MITFEEVSFARGPVRVLDRLTVEVAAGEVVALVGRSGAGKSTVLKLINRMLEPTAGRVAVDGRDVRGWDVIALRRSTGFMIQDVGLFPHMNVARNVAVVPTLLQWDAARIAARTSELLALVGLAPDEYAHRWPHELSGGQRQRVGVARALAADPPVLLMDEPFGALDPVTRAEIHGVFRDVQSAMRRTVVLVTHDMREALTLANRVGVLADGILAVCDTPARVLASSHPAVRLLLDAAGVADTAHAGDAPWSSSSAPPDATRRSPMRDTP